MLVNKFSASSKRSLPSVVLLLLIIVGLLGYIWISRPKVVPFSDYGNEAENFKAIGLLSQQSF